VNKDGFKLNGTHQLVVYAGDVNILGWSIKTIKITDYLVVASKEIGLEVYADKTWSCLGSRMRDEIIIWTLIIVSLKGRKISNIWEKT